MSGLDLNVFIFQQLDILVCERMEKYHDVMLNDDNVEDLLGKLPNDSW